jgi:outer membrane protein assembly factor BamB
MSAKTHVSRISIVLGLFTISFLLMAAFPSIVQAKESLDWTGVGGNYPFNFDYSYQAQITPQNVKNLQISWLYPVPPAPDYYKGDEGIVHTPIVVNGISYAITNYHLLLAQDIRDGKVIWQKDIGKLTFTNLDIGAIFGLSLKGHYHAIWYTGNVRGTPLIWIQANNYTLFAFNALTGDLNLRFNTFDYLHETVPGNFGQYSTYTPQIVIDENDGILVAGTSVGEGTNAARGFFLGYDITQTPPKRLWQSFVIPPQDGSDPNWAAKSVNNMTYAYLFDGKNQIDLKAMSASQLQSVVGNDWGNFGFNGTHSFAGANTGWGGSWALDPSTGIAYLATAQPSPDWNASTRPGPNLWSDSVLALNDKTGKFIWGFQTTSHDLWDWDCSWSVILANATINGVTQKEVFKGCKNGYIYALNAATGHMDWAFNAPSYWRPATSQLLNPLSSSDMHKQSQFAPATSGIQNPTGSGGIESDPAYDPTTNTVIVGTYNAPSKTAIGPVKGPGILWGVIGQNFTGGGVGGPTNTTVWAIDASTGKAKWNYFLDKVGFRGGLTASNGVVYVPSPDGSIYFLDESTGKLAGSKFIGAVMITQPALAADASGNVKLISPASGASTVGTQLGFPTSPGFMFALGLPAAAPVQTTTVVQSTTIVQSTVQTITSAPTIAGIDPTTFYATASALVIFIIATGVLAVRRRKPAP